MARNKISAYALTARADALAETLLELGYHPNDVSPSHVVATGPAVHVFADFDEDRIYFAKADTFQRWGNSRDYVFHGILEDKDGLAAVLRVAEGCAAKGLSHEANGFEPISLTLEGTQAGPG